MAVQENVRQAPHLTPTHTKLVCWCFQQCELIQRICLLQIEQLDIPAVAAQRSFLWIWCGNTEGLERGRLVGPVHMWLTVTLASCWSLLQQKHFLTSLDRSTF